VRVPLPLGAQAIFVGKPNLMQQMLKMPTIQRAVSQNALKRGWALSFPQMGQII